MLFTIFSSIHIYPQASYAFTIEKEVIIVIDAIRKVSLYGACPINGRYESRHLKEKGNN